MTTVTFTLIVSALVFTIGAAGVLLRRNPLVQFMSIELMLGAVNLALISFDGSVAKQPGEGQVFVLMVLTVAAAEAVVGLGIIVGMFRRRRRVDVDDIRAMEG
jgi:NADH-quinone oxidoreductase subunit K